MASQSPVWHDFWVTWLLCDMTSMSHELIDMGDRTYAYPISISSITQMELIDMGCHSRHDVCVTWLLSDMTSVWHDFMRDMTLCIFTLKSFSVYGISIIWVTWRLCDMTSEWHDFWETWLLSDMTSEWQDFMRDMTLYIFTLTSFSLYGISTMCDMTSEWHRTYWYGW